MGLTGVEYKYTLKREAEMVKEELSWKEYFRNVW